MRANTDKRFVSRSHPRILKMWGVKSNRAGTVVYNQLSTIKVTGNESKAIQIAELGSYVVIKFERISESGTNECNTVEFHILPTEVNRRSPMDILSIHSEDRMFDLEVPGATSK